jgi:hypothetical protein
LGEEYLGMMETVGSRPLFSLLKKGNKHSRSRRAHRKRSWPPVCGREKGRARCRSTHFWLGKLTGLGAVTLPSETIRRPGLQKTQPAERMEGLKPKKRTVTLRLACRSLRRQAAQSEKRFAPQLRGNECQVQTKSTSHTVELSFFSPLEAPSRK